MTDVTDKFTDEGRANVTADLMSLHMTYMSMSHVPARITMIDTDKIKKDTHAFGEMYPTSRWWPARFTTDQKKTYLREEAARLRKDADRLEALVEGRIVQWNESELDIKN
jgi:hypothetical protein